MSAAARPYNCSAGPATIAEDELLHLVEGLNQDPELDGFIVQLPLPSHINADRITLAIDVKADGDRWVPALKGWTEAAGVDLWTALDRFPPDLARHLLVTDVGRDGALTGPNLELLGQIIRRRPDLKVQASGGVASVADLTAAAALGCDGAIVGRALYENRFTLKQALAAEGSA